LPPSITVGLKFLFILSGIVVSVEILSTAFLEDFLDAVFLFVFLGLVIFSSGSGSISISNSGLNSITGKFSS
jgi:hypothetical protein